MIDSIISFGYKIDIYLIKIKQYLFRLQSPMDRFFLRTKFKPGTDQRNESTVR